MFIAYTLILFVCGTLRSLVKDDSESRTERKLMTFFVVWASLGLVAIDPVSGLLMLCIARYAIPRLAPHADPVLSRLHKIYTQARA